TGGGHDPGPRFFPRLLSWILLAFGIGYAVQAALVAFLPGLGSQGIQPVQQDGAPSAQIGWRWLILLALLVLYVFAIGWVGFSVSTWLMATGMMIGLGNRWWVAAGVALVMVVAVRVLFVILFRVQLPAGELGLPF
ncbi:MAG: tripartite tricarboxylate transporter TctB family protein, partial [Planctomycetaceae bacterium]